MLAVTAWYRLSSQLAILPERFRPRRLTTITHRVRGVCDCIRPTPVVAQAPPTARRISEHWLCAAAPDFAASNARPEASRHAGCREIDRRAALECEGVVHKDERRDSRQQSGSVEIGSVHGLSTSRPSAERDTQGRSLPLGNCDGSSLLTHGWASSRPSCRQRRTVLTLVQPLSSSPSTLARRL